MYYIRLTKNYITAIDDDMLEVLNQYLWHALDAHPRVVYAARWLSGVKPRRSVRMHHEIMGVTPEELNENNLVIDHIDGDGLNNQKHNLRIATREVNIRNSIHCFNAKGIYYEKVRDRYKAFSLYPVRTYIGTFRTYEEALEAKQNYADNQIP
ncbi:MAG: HNH endonuclease [Desulfosporosinus sp.]|nr:HNH endonuclease [Desulfosporosinus sp.]